MIGTHFESRRASHPAPYCACWPLAFHVCAPALHRGPCTSSCTLFPSPLFHFLLLPPGSAHEHKSNTGHVRSARACSLGRKGVEIEGGGRCEKGC